MKWWRRFYNWVHLNLLEGKLQRHGYRRLHEEQVTVASARTKRVIHDLADAVIMLRTVADEVEQILRDMDGEEFE